MVNIKGLTKQIDQITRNDAGEADLYAYVKDLLTRSSFGLGLKTNQVVIDSRIDDSLRRPDLVAYKTLRAGRSEARTTRSPSLRSSRSPRCRMVRPHSSR